MSDLLKQANEYVSMHRAQINRQFRPHFHVATPVGWINDPNGFCLYQGVYHLFAQFHPYDSAWGPMHWGHWTSEDLVSWQWRGVALAPDHPYDDLGCFSGTALEVDGRLIVIYTGVHRNEQGVVVQEQCIAESRDGISFEKWSCNPVIRAQDLPSGSTAVDFRDPKLLRTEEGFRVIAAHRGPNGGRQVSFASDDLKHWRYEGVLLEQMGDMPECPDCMQYGDKTLMITSVMGLPQDGIRFQNGHHDAIYIIGTQAQGKLHVETMEAVDLGTDFYAPQCTETPDGRHVMIAWMDMWQTDSPLHYLQHGWRGQLTLAREITLREGRLYQQPVRELQKLRMQRYRVERCAVAGESVLPGLDGRRFELIVDIELLSEGHAEIRLLKKGDAYFSVQYHWPSGILTADRSRCGYTKGEAGAREEKPMGQVKIAGAPRRMELQIIVDENCVEVFADRGSAALTMLVFPSEAASEISFEGNFYIHTLSKWAWRDA